MAWAPFVVVSAIRHTSSPYCGAHRVDRARLPKATCRAETAVAGQHDDAREMWASDVLANVNHRARIAASAGDDALRVRAAPWNEVPRESRSNRRIGAGGPRNVRTRERRDEWKTKRTPARFPGRATLES